MKQMKCLFLVLSLFQQSSPLAQTLCGKKFSSTPIESDFPKLLAERLDFPNGAMLLNSPNIEHGYLRQFREETFHALRQRNIFSDPIELLRRQRELYAGLKVEVEVFDMLINGLYGEIDNPGCLSAALLQRHLQIHENLGIRQATEFGAFILTKHDRLRVYFISNSDPFLPHVNSIGNLLDIDYRNGFKVAVHLHNHPFFLDNPTGDIAGTTMPSGADRLYYLRMMKNYSLSEAWISTGLSELKIKSKAFYLFPEFSVSSNEEDAQSF